MSHIVLSQPKNQQFEPNHISPRTNTEQTTRLGTLDKKIRRGGDDSTIGALTYHLALSNLYMVMPSVFEL